MVMQKMLVPIVTILFISLLSGCKKYACCGYPEYDYLCTNGSIHTFVRILGKVDEVQSMVSGFFKIIIGPVGYSCNVTVSFTTSPVFPTCVFGSERIRRAIRMKGIHVLMHRLKISAPVGNRAAKTNLDSSSVVSRQPV